MNVDTSVPTPEDLANQSMVDSFAPTEKKSDDETIFDVFLKKKGDGRYVVRFTDHAVATFGSSEEGYSLMRFSVKIRNMAQPVFDDNQISNGRLEYVESIPSQLKSNILQLMADMPDAAESLLTYSKGGQNDPTTE
jgi:hypothetical protein